MRAVKVSASILAQLPSNFPGCQRLQTAWFRPRPGAWFRPRMERGMSPASDPTGSSKTGGVGKMALSRWSPMGELAGLHTAMDRLFSDFFGGPLLESGEASSRTWYLPVDVIDEGSAYLIKAAVPGFTPEEVEVTFSDGVLNISAQHKQEWTSKNSTGNYLRRELTFGSYARSMQLPGDVKGDQIKATFDNGILTVDVPKMPAAQ